jgi:CheY-like chemotaxis protein
MTADKRINLMDNTGSDTEGAGPPVCLVVEDEPAILRVIVLALRDLGCAPVPAPSAEAALQILERDGIAPTVTITDVRLPGIDGVELTRLIKANSRLAETTVILMSAYGEPREHQGDAFLPKPFDINELGAFVMPYIARSR